MNKQRTKDYAEECAFCGLAHKDVYFDWYRVEMPLCPLCRELVVKLFNKNNPSVSIFASESNDFLYYRKMKTYIEQVAHAPAEERAIYVTNATPKPPDERPYVPVAPPTKKLTKKAQEEADHKNQFRQVQMSMFPPD